MQFQNRNPLDAAFWDERFAGEFTPWDLGGVPQHLQQFIQDSPIRQNCLIPGCGLGYEVAAMSARGWQVIAIDFSTEAVSRAKQFLGSAAAHVEQADFFRYRPPQALTLIYERAFLCALPPTMRAKVVERWAELLPLGGTLVGFFFIEDGSDANPKGPPFSISFDALKGLLSPYFFLETNQLVEQSIEVFQGREYWQIWTRR